MADYLHKRTKINLADSTSTNSNNNNNNNNDEIAPVIIKGKEKEKMVDIANSEKIKREEFTSNNNKGKRKVEDINKCESDSDNIQNIEQQQTQQQSVSLFSGDIIIYQLLQATNLFFQLDVQSILSLSLTSKTLFNPLSSLISQHFTFYPKHTPLIHYHPKKLKIKTFDIDGLFDDPYLLNVTKIEFKNGKNPLDYISTRSPFDEAIANLFSLNLTHLTIEGYFNQPINILIHLTKLTHLEFEPNTEFNQPIDNSLPPNLTHLSLGSAYNHRINHFPPIKITHLSFSSEFNNPINHLLPLNLVYLMLGIHFNRPINFLYLTKLTHLEFDFLSKFNQPIDNLLPPNLTNLSLGMYYNHPIDHLPKSLTHLELGPNFKHSISNLPPNLAHLKISEYTPLQYEQIRKRPSLLYFNNKPVRPNKSNQEKK